MNGRSILQQLNIKYLAQHADKVALTDDQRAQIHIPHFPWNMHPEHNVERRLAREQALQRRLINEERVFCVDATDYPDREATDIAVADSKG